MPKNDPAGRAGPTCRRRTKTVLAEVGPALIEVACDRNGSVELAIVPKRVHRKEGVDQIVLSLTVRRLTSGEVVTHFAVYGARVSRDTISRITDAVLEVINERLEAQEHAGGVQVYAHVAGHLRRQVADPTGRSARVLTPPRCSGVWSLSGVGPARLRVQKLVPRSFTSAALSATRWPFVGRAAAAGTCLRRSWRTRWR